ncbi:MAG: lysozyme [Prevotella sp.]|uniref:glycoside hydrolase family protein n=1 Tax=Bacteroidales TaxID=171549 RepID=UPI0025B3E636|nr:MULTISPECIES: lysozyme [Bacteroidales]MCX4294408.1 lysozyme [Prevotella sp.]
MQNKRKTILTLLLACISIGSNADTPTMQHLMELPPFERAVLIIKYYETLHRPEHWPTIGYGHVVQPGESYCKGLQLTESQADNLLRKDLRKFCALYRSYGADSLLLACLSYNCGPAKVLGGKGYMKSRLLQRIEAGDRNILTDYLSFCHYKGKIHYGIYRRRWVEYQLLYSDNDKPVLK